MEKGGVCSLAIFDKRPFFWSEVMHQLWFCFLMQISCPQHCGRKYDIMAWEHASNPENWNRHRNTENKQYSLFAGFADFKAILIIFQGCNLGSRILGAWGWWHLCGRFEIKEVGWTEHCNANLYRDCYRQMWVRFVLLQNSKTDVPVGCIGRMAWCRRQRYPRFLPPSTGSAC